MNKTDKRDIFSTILNDWRWLVAIFLLIVAIIIFSFMRLIPKVAEYAASKVPLKVEEAIGESAYKQISEPEDEKKSALVQSFFDEMNFDKNYDYIITVLDTKTVNAFAVPGGKIAVYNGILEEMDSLEELAALLAHESAHVELKHSLKGMFRALSGYLFVSIIFGDAGGITAVVVDNINVFQNLQYSRSMEKEADMQGLKYLESSQINPQGMLDLFKTLTVNEDSIQQNKLSEFVSTHPLTQHRTEYIKKHIDDHNFEFKYNAKLDSIWHEIKKSDNLEIENSEENELKESH